MTKLVVLGGSGSVGSTAVRTLADSGVFSEIKIADKNLDKAEELAQEVEANARAVKFDAGDPQDVRKTVEDSDLALNCVGPFYAFGPPILEGVTEAGIDYVDICDDLDATEELLGMNDKAEAAGISALIGMGSSPGIANLLVKFCADYLLEDVDSVDIYHAHGGEESEGPAVVKHRIHSMSIPIPVYDEGEYKRLSLFEDEGKSYQKTVEFHDIGKYDVYLYPHPETITLPEHIEGVNRVTNLGLVLPPEYAQYIKGMVRMGITEEEPINVQGQEVEPLEFAVAYILSKRDELTKQAGITGPMGCLKIDVSGKNEDGKERTYVFSMSSKTRGMGEGTGIPAALGAILMAQGEIKEKGVLPPEACVDPVKVLELAQETVESEKGSGFPIFIEKIDNKGNREEIDVEGMF